MRHVTDCSIRANTGNHDPYREYFTDKTSGIPVDGKSILGLATLGAAEGSTLVITAEGHDEQDAIKQLVDLVERGFDED